MPSDRKIEQAFRAAAEQYAALGVNVESALRRLSRIPVSIHCWQGDDVRGFESGGSDPGGGLAVTGTHPGRARTPGELRSDLEAALRLVPGTHRLNLHASYAETGGTPVERTDLEPAHFEGWIDWARARRMGMDFNPTYFGHPKAADGFTLAHADRGIRDYWVEHGIACRVIGAAMGRALGSPCVTNFWVPDGFKDTPVDRSGPRVRLAESLDRILARRLPARHNLDAVEAKLFGIGSESYVAGSHEFYLGYAIRNRKLLCLDAGHFHPTESIADKISSVLQWTDGLLLHVSRGIRWDSDHVVTLTDDLQAITQEVLRGAHEPRVHFGLDYFDASINRVAAWVIGTRALLKAILLAALEPLDRLRRAEAEGDYTSRLALLEECRSLPHGAVWDYHCLKAGVPARGGWLDEVRRYERQVLSKR